MVDRRPAAHPGIIIDGSEAFAVGKPVKTGNVPQSLKHLVTRREQMMIAALGDNKSGCVHGRIHFIHLRLILILEKPDLSGPMGPPPTFYLLEACEDAYITPPGHASSRPVRCFMLEYELMQAYASAESQIAELQRRLVSTGPAPRRYSRRQPSGY
jgi:hypothetical protein